MKTRRSIVVLLAVAMALLTGVVLPPRYAVSATVFFVLGIAGLLLAVWALFQRVRVDTDTSDLPDPELPQPARVPGSDFDTKLARSASIGARNTSHTRTVIRDRLETVAQSILMTAGRLSPTEATTHLRTGDWTDNRVAAAFLGNADLPRPPIYARVTNAIGRSSRFTDAIEATVTALAAYAGIDTTPHQPTVTAWLRTRVRGDMPAPTTANDTDATTQYPDPTDPPMRRHTHHWRGISALALGGLAAGLLFETPGLLLAAAIGAGYTAYARPTPSPTPDVSVTHTLSDATPTPGTTVTVTVTATNDGDHTLSDLRLIDGVPPTLGVDTGSPRHATVLPPNESTTYEYTIDARRGTHTFTPTRVRARNIADTVEIEASVDTDTTITCRPSLTSGDPVTVREAVTRYVGQVPTRTGGHGIEFHSTREYRRGDAINRIDWHRLARTNDLATIAYREERATNLAIVVDTRAAAYVAADPFAVHAADRSATAAATLTATFLAAANTVGLVAFGPDQYWLPPTASRHVQDRIQSALTDHPAFSQHPPTGTLFTTDWLTEFRHRIPQPAHVVFLSPVCDSVPVRVAHTLDAYGYPVTVLSPDPTTQASTGQLLAKLERRTRLNELRQVPVDVIDWGADEPLAVAIARTTTRRSP